MFLTNREGGRPEARRSVRVEGTNYTACVSVASIRGADVRGRFYDHCLEVIRLRGACWPRPRPNCSERYAVMASSPSEAGDPPKRLTGLSGDLLVLLTGLSGDLLALLTGFEPLAG